MAFSCACSLRRSYMHPGHGRRAVASPRLTATQTRSARGGPLLHGSMHPTAPPTTSYVRSGTVVQYCTVSQLEHARRRADREHQRRAREQAEARSDEVVRMAQEHYLLWRPEE